MPIGYWPSRPDKVSEVVQSLAGGMDESVSPIELLPEQLEYVSNMDSELYPTLQTRRGCAEIFTLSGSGSFYIVVYKDRYYLLGQGGMIPIQGGNFLYTIPDNPTQRWSHSRFYDGEYLYILAGSPGPGKLQRFNGTSVSVVADAPPDQSFVASHSNRLFLASTQNNMISYSGLRAGDDWSSTSDIYTGPGKIAVETEDGEMPTGMIEFGGSLIIFKRFTMHKLYGDDASNFELGQAFAVGCISADTIVVNDGLLYWLASDGFYVYDGGSAPVNISRAIEAYIRQVNSAYAKTCCAGCDGRFIHISLALGGENWPSVCFKFDLRNRTWWRSSLLPRSYYKHEKKLLSYLPPTASPGSGIMEMNSESYTDKGSQIFWEARTKPFSVQTENRKKVINRVYAVVDMDPSATLDISYAMGPEGSSWNPVYTSTVGAGEARILRIPLITRPGPNDYFRIRFKGSGRVKVHRLILETTRRGN